MSLLRDAFRRGPRYCQEPKGVDLSPWGAFKARLPPREAIFAPRKGGEVWGEPLQQQKAGQVFQNKVELTTA